VIETVCAVRGFWGENGISVLEKISVGSDAYIMGHVVTGKTKIWVVVVECRETIKCGTDASLLQD
jgi:hypothetical protein